MAFLVALEPQRRDRSARRHHSAIQ